MRMIAVLADKLRVQPQTLATGQITTTLFQFLGLGDDLFGKMGHEINPKFQEPSPKNQMPGSLLGFGSWNFGSLPGRLDTEIANGENRQEGITAQCFAGPFQPIHNAQ